VQPCPPLRRVWRGALGLIQRLGRFPLASTPPSGQLRTDIRPRTRNQYESLLKNHLEPPLGNRPIAKVTTYDVRIWHAELHNRLPGTAAPAYRLLRAIFSTAVEDETVSRNPCKIRGARSDTTEIRPLPSLDDVQKLFNALPPGIRVTVLLAAWGTLRRGEVLGLQRRDIDFDRRSVHVERTLVEPSNGKLHYGPTKNGEDARCISPKMCLRFLPNT
jgi:integrase